MALFNRRLRVARRPAKELVERAIGHREPLAVVEVLHVEPEAAIVFEIDQMPVNRLLIKRPPVGREAHQLVLPAVDLEPAIVRKRGIQEPERMRKLNPIRQLDPVPAPDAHRRRRPFPDAVERQDRRLVKRTREERAGGVTFVVIGKHDRYVCTFAEALSDGVRQPNLFLEPHGYRHVEAAEPAWRIGDDTFRAGARISVAASHRTRRNRRHALSCRIAAGSIRWRAPEIRDRAFSA